ncbi:tetratricopeptide repeat protein [Vitreoscilla massiliensis]|uniref:Tetratricopeptide repeat protein n=1 Tax=Vitreoscilla massiliensis TaxID=1689272 RepID=A0ABY4E1J2_9NEIS|nr:tetratricopeptide repeat protein [Vitreoscilla massiliensis]UOO89663.1 tetratricopeptide repeat protein [Vitreoscilla massiliensis]
MTLLSLRSRPVLQPVLLLLLACSANLASAQTDASAAERGIALNNHGHALAEQGLYAQAQQYYQQALPDLTATDARTQRNRAATLNNLGVALAQQGQLPTAEAAFTEAWTLRQHVLGANAADLIIAPQFGGGVIGFTARCRGLHPHASCMARAGAIIGATTCRHPTQPQFYRAHARVPQAALSIETDGGDTINICCTWFCRLIFSLNQHTSGL